ncbi:hypothetical protein PJ985_21845 [Streptomyces sp. ACA25]|uniref:hypothetical protein n=1 Tax=Streptomyces sp. ACA25 TaxID=3022596 RepID=UPI00230773FB|nr:hypothetical protein [Streptomyces sp. ACA25]MDB1090201.1 hypothetical protein [Streptomyces sp. ACA25]
MSAERAEEIARENLFPLAGDEAGETLIARADAVRQGDFVLACFPESATADTPTTADAIPRSEPYTANPAPYNPPCCQACEIYTLAGRLLLGITGHGRIGGMS